MATTSNVTMKRTTRGGTDLESFEDVLLYKEVPVVAEVTSVQEALHRLGNDQKKLLAIIRDGLQQEAIEAARESDEGWKLKDENGKDTEKVYSGTLVDSEVLNPVVLMFAKMNFGDIYEKDTSKAKEEARKMIKATPSILEGIKKKSAENRKASK